MKTKRQKAPDPAAEEQFINDNMARCDWLGDAGVNLALMAADLGVLWPPCEGVGADTDLALKAHEKIELCTPTGASLEMAFEAGRALERVSARLAEFKKFGKGAAGRKRNKRANTAAFEAIAAHYIAMGKPLGTAQQLTSDALKKYKNRFDLKTEFAELDLAKLATRLNRRRKRGV